MSAADALQLPELCALDGPVVYFPVRHHSPTAARLVRDLIDRLKPAFVLIEGPADFQPRMSEFFLAHRPPIAIYSFILLADDAGKPGARRAVYYPFCEHSPEWQAARYGNANNAAVKFIDLPWADLADLPEEQETNRYADRHLTRSRYTRMLCDKLRVDNFNDAWDRVCEVDPSITIEEYLQRCHALCTTMRTLDEETSTSDRLREEYMASHIRAAVAEQRGPVLVVTGGYHSLGLLQLVNQPEPAPAEANEPKVYLDRGIALTPYSFERLDSLTGYDAGMPNPGFYHEVWKTRNLNLKQEVHPLLMKKVAVYLRNAKQQISSADLIGSEATARALAAVRGHAIVWRTDFLDGLTAAIVKEDLTAARRHPVLDAIHYVLRGGERGQLAEGTQLPPLVLDIQNLIAQHSLELSIAPRTLELNLSLPEPREQSQIMHGLRLLALGGFSLVDSTLSDPTSAELRETWELAWTPDFDAHCIEASRYGATLTDAVSAKLTETAQCADRDAGLAAGLVLDAALAGLHRLSDDLFEVVRKLIHSDASFFNVAIALRRLLTLYRYDQHLGAIGRPDLGMLLKECYQRVIWLFESLGQSPGQEQQTIDGIRVMIDTLERCDVALGLDPGELVDVFHRVAADSTQLPTTRGATLGGLWFLGKCDSDSILKRFREFTNPNSLGDFLTGLFALAREQVQRHRALILAIHEVLLGFEMDDFLEALPALRLAFTYFTPREKHQLALTLRQALGLSDAPELAALKVDTATALLAMQFEQRLFDVAKQYGIQITPDLDERQT